MGLQQLSRPGSWGPSALGIQEQLSWGLRVLALPFLGLYLGLGH